MSAAEKREHCYRLSRTLPDAVRGDRRLTNAAICVAAVLKNRVDQSSEPVVELSKRELAARAGLSKRACDEAVEQLINAGLVSRTRRPNGQRIHDENLYEMTGCLRRQRVTKRRVKPARAQGAEKDVAYSYPIDTYLTSTHPPSPQACRGVGKRRFATGCEREARTTPAKVVPDRGIARYPAIPPINGAPPDDLALAKRALLSLAKTTRGIDTSSRDLDDLDGIIELTERLMGKRISGFSPGYWRASVRRHGFNAYLAVIETLLIADIRSADNKDCVVSLAGYLGGILRKPPGDDPHCARPHITLGAILESRAVWLDGRIN